MSVSVQVAVKFLLEKTSLHTALLTLGLELLEVQRRLFGNLLCIVLR